MDNNARDLPLHWPWRRSSGLTPAARGPEEARRTREAGGKEAGAMRVCLSPCLSLETETEREIELAGDSDNPPTHMCVYVCARVCMCIHVPIGTPSVEMMAFGH
jgi:hypothetical protein